MLSAASTRPARHLVWVLTRAALTHIVADPVALGIVRQGRIYEIVSGSAGALPGVSAVVTEAFPSYAQMAATVAGGSLLPGVRALLYDPEHWTRTPRAEQRNVRRYLAEAVTLARRHGLRIILTPGLDLVRVLLPRMHGTAAARFLASGVEAAAAGADVVDVQAQSLEAHPAAYARFVERAAHQVHRRNRLAVVIAGLSTNPPDGPVTAGVIERVVEAVEGGVRGFWLNMPRQGESCPRCSRNVNWRAGTSALDALWG